MQQYSKILKTCIVVLLITLISTKCTENKPEEFPQPDTPTVTATTVENGVKLSWNKVFITNESINYEIQRSNTNSNENPNWFSLAEVTETDYIDNAPNSGSNSYRVQASYDKTGPGIVFGEWSNSVSIEYTKLSPPTNVTATQSGSSINISWNAVSGATNYFVYRSNSATGTYSSLTSVTGTNVTDTSPLSGDNYYKVIASDGTTTSDYSNYANCNFNGGGTTSSVPTGLVATASGMYHIAISWNGVQGATGYKIYWCSSATGSYWLDDTSNTTSYTDYYPNNGNNYYKVTAVKGSNESDFSDYCYYNFSANYIECPGKIVAIQSGNSIVISWNSVPGAQGYTVCHSKTRNGSYDDLRSSDTNTYTDNSPYPGDNYYGVAAKLSPTSSTGYSQDRAAYCYFSGNGFSAPTGVTAIQSGNNIIVSWNPVQGAISYEVKYNNTLSGNRYYMSYDVTGTSITYPVQYVQAAAGPWYFWIVAYNGSIYSDDSADYAYLNFVPDGGGDGGGTGGGSGGGTTTTKLATPTGLTAVSGDSFVQISFNIVPLAYTYELYRSTSASGVYSKISALDVGTNVSYTIETLLDSYPLKGTSYYKVKAIPPSIMPNLTASDLSNYVSITR